MISWLIYIDGVNRAPEGARFSPWSLKWRSLKLNFTCEVWVWADFEQAGAPSQLKFDSNTLLGTI